MLLDPIVGFWCLGLLISSKKKGARGLPHSLGGLQKRGPWRFQVPPSVCSAKWQGKSRPCPL